MSLDVYLTDPETDEELFTANITHNLGKMASAAGIYQIVWRPEEVGIMAAGQLIERLTVGIDLMATEREWFEGFNAPNDWGKYEHFLPWLQDYLKACRNYPFAKVRTSR